MSGVVIDANLCLALALPLPYSANVLRRMQTWSKDITRILVPSLWEYEITSGLRRACALGFLTPEQALIALDELLGMDLEVIQGTLERHRRALGWAEQLGQARAYDAQYLALADELHLPFWTADRRLVNNVQHMDVDWVHWIGEN
jgi:predicted nucleic acid-binding protein